MTSSWQQSHRGAYGQTTSVDIVRQQTYSTTSLVGLKRNHDEIKSEIEPALRKPIIPTTKSFQVPKSVTRLEASKIKTVQQNSQCITKIATAAAEQSEHYASTPGPSQNPLLSLRHPRYSLPTTLINNFEALGVRAIYPWQSACLLGKGLLTGERNLVYAAPTGGGKSLVADVLAIKRIISNPGKKAIIVLPYVALVQEKLRWLRAVVDGVEKAKEKESVSGFKSRISSRYIRISGFTGVSKTNAVWSDFDIAVCTIEKANSLINAAIEEGQIHQLCAIVFDEFHMLDDEHRGYILELMATKLLFLDNGIQMIGMSATLSNVQVLASWLRAHFYISNYRPIAIYEHIVYDNSIYSLDNAKGFFQKACEISGNSISSTPKPCQVHRIIDNSQHKELGNPINNAVVALALETVLEDYGVLLFCGSRSVTEKMALLVSEAMPHLLSQESLEKREDVLASLRTLPNGFEPIFSKTILAGVGFHHAGLTIEEREIVSEAYDSGVLKVMVATCSLAAGINLPARRVILNGARMGRDLVGPAMLRQMRGRAGRKGKDEVGETYLCCSKADLEAVAELVEAEMPPVSSCMASNNRGVKRALLEVIATRLATSHDCLEDYIRCSLLWQTADHANVQAIFDTALAELLSSNIIVQPDPDHKVYEPTLLGSAIVASALTPEDGLFVHSEMQRALSSFVMDSELHILYLFTPIPSATISPQDQPISWPVFRAQIDGMTEPDLRALHAIGVSPSLINKLVLSGATTLPPSSTETELRIYRRAYTALQLRALCNEVPVHKIARTFSVPRGQVQNLSQTCHGFAAGMIKFCNRMGSSFSILGAVLDHMQDRLRTGARSDLLEMAQVTFVKSRMARVFWEEGYKSVRALAEASVDEVARVMMGAMQGKLRNKGQGAERLEAEEKLKAKVKEKAEVVVKSAGKVYERTMLVELDE